MNTYYLDYKLSKSGIRTIHKAGCHAMPKIDSCLLLGEFYSSSGLYNYTTDQFPQWRIEKCQCCE
ncbi:hypothetical protein [Carboxylicivirga sp. RSCT41]|uniref:hypothetical protein n=1 Tax=Carboxylicivirga agarovorans TaxID=3417570 RepID=UPI003D359981